MTQRMDREAILPRQFTVLETDSRKPATILPAANEPQLWHTKFHVEKSVDKLPERKKPKIFKGNSDPAPVGTPPRTKRSEQSRQLLKRVNQGYENSFGGYIAKSSLSHR